MVAAVAAGAGGGEAVEVGAGAAAPTGKEVFVAGAGGRTGRRVVKELLAAGWRVRAGVRSGGSGFPEEYAAGAEPGQLVEVEFDLTRPSSLPPALGGAEAVVCCVGAPEDAFNRPSAPREIDGEGVAALAEAAKAAGSVGHVVLVSSLGAGKFGLPASLLNLFWEVLKWKRVGEEALIASGVPYTILRPGGMEKPGDDYGDDHSLVFAEEDSRFGGQVSRLQIAQVAAEALRLGPEGAAANKVVEVVAEKTAPRRAAEDLFEAIEAEAAPLPGTPEAYTSKYAYQQSATERFLEIMGPGGSLPESLNGRLAMLGFAAALAQEKLHPGLKVADQLGQPAALGWALGLVAAVQLASLAPLAQGAEPRDAKAGPFRAQAELLNGRLAMLALTGGAAWEAQSGAPFASLVPDLPENFWTFPDLSALPGLAALGLALALLAISSLALAPVLVPVFAELSAEGGKPDGAEQ